MANYIIRDGELYHWKYIKRERVNGKWRYYYDSDQMKKDLGVNARDNAKSAYNHAVDNKLVMDAKKNGPAPEGAHKNRDVFIAKKKYETSVDNYRKAQTEFHKTPLGKLDKLVESGKSVVEKILRKDIWKEFDKRKK